MIKYKANKGIVVVVCCCINLSFAFSPGQIYILPSLAMRQLKISQCHISLYQYVKGCKRFHTGVKSVSSCNFYVLSIYIMTYNTRFVFQTKK